MSKDPPADEVALMKPECGTAKYDYLRLKSYSVAPESGDADTVVITLDTQRHLRVRRRALRIMEAFDGSRRLSDVRMALAQGEAPVICDDEQLRRFVDSVLIDRGLLVGTPEPTRTTRGGSLWVRFPLVHTDTLGAVFRLGKHLYRRSAVLVGLVTCALLLVLCAVSVYSADMGSSVPNSGWLIVISYLSLVIHEFGHVSAVYRYGLTAGRGGIGIYMFIPVFFVDLSSAWRLGVRQRVVVDLGGMYFQILTTIPLAIVGLLYDDARYCMMALSVALLTAVNLLPFARLDGYWILSDSLGMDNLSTNAWRVMREAMRGRRSGYGRKYEIAAGFFVLSSCLMIIAGLAAAYSAVTRFSTIAAQLRDAALQIVSGSFADGLSLLDNAFISCVPLLFVAFLVGNIMTKFATGLIKGIRTSKGATTR